MQLDIKEENQPTHIILAKPTSFTSLQFSGTQSLIFFFPTV